MYQVAFFSLIAPETREAGITITRRAGICLADKLGAISPGAFWTFFYEPAAGQVVVRCQSEDALMALPESIGSPVGHFGQFERLAVPARVRTGRYAVVYSLKPAFTIYRVATKQRLTGQVAGRLSAFLSGCTSGFEGLRG